MKKKDLRVPVGFNEELHLHVTYPFQNRNLDKFPCAILSHGFTVDGTESHRMFLKLANRLAMNGMIVINFDYRGSGYSDGEFEDLTVTREIEDLKAVVDYAVSMQKVDHDRIVVIGQSLGSYISILALYNDKRIKAFVLWGTPVELYKKFYNYFGKAWEEKGVICQEKGFYLKKDFLVDFKKYDELLCISKIEQPILFIHAGNDEKNPVNVVRILFEKAKEPKTVEIIGGANHSFKCQKELEEKAIDKTTNWLSRILRSDSNAE